MSCLSSLSSEDFKGRRAKSLEKTGRADTHGTSSGATKGRAARVLRRARQVPGRRDVSTQFGRRRHECVASMKLFSGAGGAHLPLDELKRFIGSAKGV
ncbi:hypothetical protein E2C01_008451 [Portunus trituberculatus]|uniref:Uncharacterized protein n=1 Tax=Portunus trituberculatus TaxID=210409 RepID=A0A5B7D0T7_PORTR|nr:hypothetical protein [Portunus trituberculatus]